MVSIISYQDRNGKQRRTIPPQAVKSSSVYKVAYSSRKDMLFVIFQSTKNLLYLYPGASSLLGVAPDGVIDQIVATQSIGSFVSTQFVEHGVFFDRRDLTQPENVGLRDLVARTVDWCESEYEYGQYTCHYEILTDWTILL